MFPHSPRHEQIRFGCRRHFRLAPWTDLVEVYWGRGCQITVTPVGPEEICLAATSRDPRMKLQGALLEIPQLAARVAGAQATTQERGAITALRSLRDVAQGRFTLVGDASGSVDPVTGEGLGLAFRQADALTDALRDNRLETYRAAHARISRIPRRMSRLMLLMDAHPWFRKRVMLALQSEPHLFSLLLNVHILALDPLAFGATNALRLGWRLLATPGAL
jgi:2-polyprenyl-6-methoxyphenol hydroxylase-like FAD-dependent oxidoreductase